MHTVISFLFIFTYFLFFNTISPTDKFDWENLDHNLHTEITNKIWNHFNNTETFEKQLLEFDHLNQSKQMSICTVSNKLVQGASTPIHFYTVENGKPKIITVGNILNAAKPINNKNSKDTTVELFLQRPDKKQYHATLKAPINSTIKPIIKSACLSPTGDIALFWQDLNSFKQQNSYIQLLMIDDVKQNQTIQLDTTQNFDVVVKRLSGKAYQSCNTLKIALFTLDGQKLALCNIGSYYEIIDYNNKYIQITPHEVNYIDITQKAPLTDIEKAKRLGIATAATKNLLKK